MAKSLCPRCGTELLGGGSLKNYGLLRCSSCGFCPTNQVREWTPGNEPHEPRLAEERQPRAKIITTR